VNLSTAEPSKTPPNPEDGLGLAGGQAAPAEAVAAVGRTVGQQLGPVTVYTGADAQALAVRHRARAVTYGNEIAFGAGSYRPGTLSGDAVLAHELAHVAQYRAGGSPGVTPGRGGPARLAEGARSPAEGNADAIAAHTLAPGGGRSSRVRPMRSLSLHGCNGPPSAAEGLQRVPTVPGLRSLEEEVGGATTPPAAAPTTTPQTSIEGIVDLGDVSWSPVGEDGFLTVWGDGRAAALPLRTFVHEAAVPTPDPTAAAARAVAQGAPQPGATAPRAGVGPQRGPVYGMVGVGHGSLQLLRTGQGVGVMIDAGGRGGTAIRGILPGALLTLRTRLGIASVEGVLIAHTHADHVRHLLELVSRGVVRSSNIWVYPGWASATQGPWARVLQGLRSAAHAAAGFGPGWSPQSLRTTQVSGPEGGVTRAELRVGGAHLQMVTRTADLRAYNTALARGETGTRLADAASMLTRIRPAGADFDILHVGDLRGENLSRLQEAMGQREYHQFVSRARVLVGFHHLGAVDPARDVPGLRSLIESASTSGQEITIVAQTRGGRANMELVRAFNNAGARVVVLGDPAAGAEQSFRVSETGAVTATGASVFEPNPAARAALAQVTRLRAGAEALRQFPDLLPGLRGRTASRAAEGFAAEADRIEVLLRERRTRAFDRLAGRDPDPRLRAIDEAMARREGLAGQFSPAEIDRLARARPHAREMAQQTAASRAAGRTSSRLETLRRTVDPEFARRVIAEEGVNRPQPRNSQRRAIKRTIQRLEKRLEEELRASTSGARSRGRGAAGLFLAIEVANQVLPLVNQVVQSQRQQRRQNAYLFLDVASWWSMRGVDMPLQAYDSDGRALTAETFGPSLYRRIWSDLEADRRRPESELPEEIRQATGLEILFIPEQSTWIDVDVTWDAFQDWMTANINHEDDWERWFGGRSGDQAIRWQGGGVQVRVGRYRDGDVEPVWEASPRLTTIMGAGLAVAERRTSRHLDLLWRQRAGPPPPGPDEPAAFRSDARRPTRHVGFRGDRPRAVYGPWDMIEARVPRWPAHPRFFVLRADAPAGYAWVIGADTATYRALRSATITSFDPEETVLIPNRSFEELRNYERSREPSEYLDPETEGEALAAWKLSGVQGSGARRFRHPSGTWEVRFIGDMPNESAMVLVASSDIVDQMYAPPATREQP
jgi:Domain of unknown function (DUF4157)